MRFIFEQIASIFSPKIHNFYLFFFWGGGLTGRSCPHISCAYGNWCHNKYTILKKYSIEYTIIRENYHQIWKKNTPLNTQIYRKSVTELETLHYRMHKNKWDHQRFFKKIYVFEYIRIRRNLIWIREYTHGVFPEPL